MAADAVAEHDQLVEAAGERGDEVDRLRERGMVGVEHLREEDELHPRRRPTTNSSTSCASSTAKRPASSASPRSSAGGLAEPLGERAVGEHATSASTSAVVSPGGRSKPSPSRDDVGDAAGVGRDDAAAAGERLDHDPAEPFRPRRQHEHRGAVDPRRDVRRGSQPWCSTLSGRSREELLDRPRLRPLADDHEPRVRDARGDLPPRRRQPVDVLVELERADEDDRRPLGQRRRGCAVNAERSLYVGKPRRRLAAHLLDQARR